MSRASGVRGDVTDRAASRKQGLLQSRVVRRAPGKLITDSSTLSWTSASLFIVCAFREGGGERCTVRVSYYQYYWWLGYSVEDVTP